MAKNLAKPVASIFASRLTTAIDYHQELLLAVHLKRHQAGLETMLAEQFALNIVVLWEVFLSDLLVSYLVMSPKRYLNGLEGRLFQSLRERYGQAISDLVDFTSPNTLSLPKARLLVDPKQFNITVQSADQLSKRANDLLAAKYARPFTLDSHDADFVDFVIALRNFLAHRSKSAHKTLKVAVTKLSGPNAVLQGPASNVGKYLKTRSANGETRSMSIGRRLIDVATLLA